MRHVLLLSCKSFEVVQASSPVAWGDRAAITFNSHKLRASVIYGLTTLTYRPLTGGLSQTSVFVAPCET